MGLKTACRQIEIEVCGHENVLTTTGDIWKYTYENQNSAGTWQYPIRVDPYCYIPSDLGNYYSSINCPITTYFIQTSSNLAIFPAGTNNDGTYSTYSTENGANGVTNV